MEHIFNCQDQNVFFYDEFSGLIYYGKIIAIQDSKAKIDTSKKCFQVPLSNVKLFHRENVLIKSEYFPKNLSESSFKTPKLKGTPLGNMTHGFFQSGANFEKGFTLPKKVNESDNSGFEAHHSNFFKKDNVVAMKKDSHTLQVLPGLGNLKNSIRLSNVSDFNRVQNLAFPIQKSQRESHPLFEKINSNQDKEGSTFLKLSNTNKSFSQNIHSNISLTRNQQMSQLNVLSKSQNPLFSFSENKPSNQEVSVNTLNQAGGSKALESENQDRNIIKEAFRDKDLINFAILFKLLQKKKKLAEKHHELIKTQSESNLGTVEQDLTWIRKSVQAIDHTLKNVWLSLKLKDKTLTEENISSNYEGIVGELKSQLQEEQAQNETTWAPDKVRGLISALNMKLESKILTDVQKDMELHFLDSKTGSLGQEEKQIIANCLGLLKSLKLNKNMDLSSNCFYQSLMKTIRMAQLGTQESLASDLSTSLIQVIKSLNA